MNISKKAFAQYEVVRRSGLTNMFDIMFVRDIALDYEFKELAGICQSTLAYSLIMKGHERSGVGALNDYDLESIAYD